MYKKNHREKLKNARKLSYAHAQNQLSTETEKNHFERAEVARLILDISYIISICMR